MEGRSESKSISLSVITPELMERIKKQSLHIDVALLINDLVLKLKDLPRSVNPNVHANIEYLKNRYSSPDFNNLSQHGNTALNRRILNDEELINHLDFPTLIEILRQEGNLPSDYVTNHVYVPTAISRSSSLTITLPQLIQKVFEGRGLGELMHLPNKGKLLGDKFYTLITPLMDRFLNIAVYSGLPISKYITNLESEAKISLLSKFEQIKKSIDQIVKDKYKHTTTDFIIAPNGGELIVDGEVNTGVLRVEELVLKRNLSLKNSKLDKQNFLNAFIKTFIHNNDIMIDDDVSHFFYDRLHLEYCILKTEPVKIGNYYYQLSDVIRQMINACESDSTAQFAQAQFRTRLGMIEHHRKFDKNFKKYFISPTEAKSSPVEERVDLPTLNNAELLTILRPTTEAIKEWKDNGSEIVKMDRAVANFIANKNAFRFESIFMPHYLLDPARRILSEVADDHRLYNHPQIKPILIDFLESMDVTKHSFELRQLLPFYKLAIALNNSKGKENIGKIISQKLRGLPPSTDLIEYLNSQGETSVRTMLIECSSEFRTAVSAAEATLGSVKSGTVEDNEVVSSSTEDKGPKKDLVPEKKTAPVILSATANTARVVNYVPPYVISDPLGNSIVFSIEIKDDGMIVSAINNRGELRAITHDSNGEHRSHTSNIYKQLKEHSDKIAKHFGVVSKDWVFVEEVGIYGAPKQPMVLDVTNPVATTYAYNIDKENDNYIIMGIDGEGRFVTATFTPDGNIILNPENNLVGKQMVQQSANIFKYFGLPYPTHMNSSTAETKKSFNSTSLFFSATKSSTHTESVITTSPAKSGAHAVESNVGSDLKSDSADKIPYLRQIVDPKDLGAVLKQADRVLRDAQDKAPISTNNAPYHTKDEKAKYADETYINRQGASDFVYLGLHAYALKELDIRRWEGDFELCTLRGIFAEITQVGNCGGLCDVAFSSIMETGLAASAELINLVIFDSKGQEDGHTFILLNRDKENSDLKNSKTWKNTILVDPWSSRHAVYCPDGVNIKDIALVPGEVIDTDIIANVNPQTYLNQIKKVLNYLTVVRNGLEIEGPHKQRIRNFDTSYSARDPKFPAFAAKLRADLPRILDNKIALYQSILASKSAGIGAPSGAAPSSGTHPAAVSPKETALPSLPNTSSSDTLQQSGISHAAVSTVAHDTTLSLQKIHDYVMSHINELKGVKLGFGFLSVSTVHNITIDSKTHQIDNKTADILNLVELGLKSPKDKEACLLQIKNIASKLVEQADIHGGELSWYSSGSLTFFRKLMSSPEDFNQVFSLGEQKPILASSKNDKP